MPGFNHVVQEAWAAPITHRKPVHRLNAKLARTAAARKEWSKKLFSEARLQFHMAQSVILQLDIAQESRTLNETNSLCAPSSKRELWV
jgi:hypothetical protein